MTLLYVHSDKWGRVFMLFWLLRITKVKVGRVWGLGSRRNAFVRKIYASFPGGKVVAGALTGACSSLAPRQM